MNITLLRAHKLLPDPSQTHPSGVSISAFCFPSSSFPRNEGMMMMMMIWKQAANRLLVNILENKKMK